MFACWSGSRLRIFSAQDDRHAGRRAQRVQRSSRKRFGFDHLLGALLPSHAHGPTSACLIRPAAVNGRPDRAGPGPRSGVTMYYKLLSFWKALFRLSQPLSVLCSPPKPSTTSKTGNNNRRSPRLIRQPPRKYPCCHTPIGRVFGLARCLGFHTFPALCRIGVSVSKSDVNPGAGPARRRQPFGSAQAKPFVAHFAIARSCHRTSRWQHDIVFSAACHAGCPSAWAFRWLGFKGSPGDGWAVFWS